MLLVFTIAIKVTIQINCLWIWEDQTKTLNSKDMINQLKISLGKNNATKVQEIMNSWL